MGGWLKGFVRAGLAVATATFVLAGAAAAQDVIRIGTSSVGSVFYTIAIGASEVITRHAKINATVEPVGGSSANNRGLAGKRIEFALANAFAAFTGYNGTHNFKKKSTSSWSSRARPRSAGCLSARAAGSRRLPT